MKSSFRRRSLTRKETAGWRNNKKIRPTGPLFLKDDEDKIPAVVFGRIGEVTKNRRVAILLKILADNAREKLYSWRSHREGKV
ncbi:MAG: hypothetical protein ACR2H1_06930 [Limisphaerales bacterium]